MARSIEYETAHEIHGWVEEVRRYINEQKTLESALEELDELLIRIEEIFLREDEQGESLEDEENREYWKNVLNDELRRNR